MIDDLTVEQTWRGPFWLPGQSSREQRGVLTYDLNNGVILSSVGGFDDGRWVQAPTGGFAMREGSGRFPVIHGRMALRNDENAEALRNDENAEARAAVALYARHINIGDPRALSVEVREAFFTLATEGVGFHAVISRWVYVNNRFRATCDMVLGLRYVKRGYLETELITAVAAAEAMHAAMEFEPPMPNSEFKALKKTLLRAVPDDTSGAACCVSRSGRWVGTGCIRRKR